MTSEKDREILSALQNIIWAEKARLWANGNPLPDYHEDQARKKVCDADLAGAMARGNLVLAKWGLQ